MRNVWMEKVKWIGALFSFCILFMTGCGTAKQISNDMKNVEERGYATVLVISHGVGAKRYHFDLGIAQEKRTGEKSEKENLCNFDCDDFQELSEEYRSVKGKDLSLTHLKVILLTGIGKDESSREIIRDTDYMTAELGELLQEMDENEEIAKTCPVLQLEDRETFLDYMDDTEEPVGTYISNLVQTGEKQGEDVPWLKDYLKMLREEEKITIYSLESVSEGWILNKVKDKGNTYDK